MTSLDNVTTVPVAPTALKPTPTGSGLSAGAWAGIGTVLSLITIILLCVKFGFGENVICRCLGPQNRARLRQFANNVIGRCLCRQNTEGQQGRSNSQLDGGTEGTPMIDIPSTSGGETNATRLEADQRRAEQATANRCQDALKQIYNNTGSFVQMRPWVDDEQKHISEIYTEPQLENGDNDCKVEVKSYCDIFTLKSREGHPIIRAILRGWAGLGKTTLLVKIAYDWARGTVAALKKYKLVFVLKMQSLQHKSDVMDAVFDQLLDENNITKNDLKSFITANPNDVLFLLDGFDEFESTEIDGAEFGSIFKMLNRRGEYEKCTVFVTTRPSHYDKLVKKSLIKRPFALVNVLGFSKDDIKKYVYNFYLQAVSKADELFGRISSSNVLSDLAKSPMLLLWMCLLWSDLESASLPDTMFRLYNEALHYIFLRKIKMSSDEISRLIVAIGEVAWDGLLSTHRNLSFQVEDFETDALTMAIRAGILTSQRVCKGVYTGKSVHFIHKTFQEFCAAVYYQSITSKKCRKQFEMFLRQSSDTAGFEYLLRFCCGDNHGPSTKSILKSLSKKVKCSGNLDDINLQIALNCYFESQSKILPPKELIRSVIAPEFIAIEDLSQDHSISLMYFLQNVTDEKRGGGNDCLKIIHALKISETTFRRLGADFVNHVNEMVNLRIIDVSLHIIDFTDIFTPTQKCQNDWSLLISSLRLKEMTELTMAGLNGCVPTTTNMEDIIGELSHLPNLDELHLSNNETLAKSGPSWSLLRNIKTLNKLDLSRCGLNIDDLEHIAVGLSNLPKLVELDLSGNETLAGSGGAWSQLGEIKTLNRLDLRYCGLESDDLKHVAFGLSNLPGFVEFNLSGNETLAGSGRPWSQLREIKTLNKLVLSCCGLRKVDLEHIAVWLSNLPKLVELDLSRNETLAGSGVAWHHLREIKTLNKLVLSRCGLRKDDLAHIAVGLSNPPKPIELDLSLNGTLAGSGCSWSVLAKMKSLRKLALSLNDLTADDKTQIIEAVSQMTNLEVKYLD